MRQKDSKGALRGIILEQERLGFETASPRRPTFTPEEEMNQFERTILGRRGSRPYQRWGGWGAKTEMRPWMGLTLEMQSRSNV